MKMITPIILLVMATTSCTKEEMRDRRITGKIIYKGSELPAANKLFGLQVWTEDKRLINGTTNREQYTFTTGNDGSFEYMAPSKGNDIWLIFSSNQTIQYWAGSPDNKKDMDIDAGTVRIDSL